MMNILVLPLFQMSSGHHQVADALIYSLQHRFPNVSCEKLDFLSYCNEQMERRVADFYLRWISLSPHSYEWMYQRWMKKFEQPAMEPWLLYFEKKMKRLLQEKKPDLVICTHSFPSHVLQRLKQRGAITVPVINVYTDFFLSGIWGKTAIDYHFVPHEEAKRSLCTRFRMERHRVIVTGIPIHEHIVPVQKIKRRMNKHILVAGGNQGLGKMKQFLKNANHSQLTYSVLCGKNENLYEELKSWNDPRIRPFRYISDRAKMNELYDEVDAVVTKPGGVTMSEVLAKKLPAFTLSYLPGQEQMNLRYLRKKELIYFLNDNEPYDQQLLRVLMDDEEMNQLEKRMKQYWLGCEKTAQEALAEWIEANIYATKKR
ncbi:galactosyldiacylglycerol synthase [Anoxybacillus gonensis]|uniref:UDP-N-acetylglucosamine--LPS N-acetylglucosamine transferase n=1 Tax=Anoxybacillus gonensis TaxID=198467 RepID=A0AAW7TH46_9BACL|nr:glycosyltransferase [Anoxybacillus gonensis]AKS37189.1 galactosyldiacylglycerol synthase [Anoxybacillus gonensis]KGP59546.1 galactosyldiacylglycerol synthase [Anoxybacillus gonensis]MDO0878728.1 UDP-N-acetylglucosamine--LPS N-acetylglucosamine transferase [Anoxybacillus gonensis]